MFSSYRLYLPAILFLLALAPTNGRTTRSTEGTQDKRLFVYAIGNWKGRFAPDDHGRGGLAALHSFVERGRKLAEDEYGSAVLLHAGDFTGAGDESAFAKRILIEEIQLARYIGLEAASLAPSEIRIVASPKDERLQRFPAVSSNVKKTGPGVRRDRILPAGRSTVWVGAYTPGPADEYDLTPSAALSGRTRAAGADAFVLLTDRTGVDDGRFAKLMLDMFALENVSNPFDALTPAEGMDRQTFVIVSGAPANKFYRLENGVRVCEIADRAVCELDLVIRGDTVIGLMQRFVNVNGANEPASWVRPDPVLEKLLRQTK